MDTPGWFKNAIIYHILIDRFAGYKSDNHWNKPGFLGGSIKGIIEKLDYIDDLGINTIWLSPFYRTSEYHGYHITDYFKVEPKFGSSGDLKALVEQAHKSNIRVIADFVPNHCSSEHPYFVDAVNNKKSKFHNWFYFKRWPEKYLCFLHIKKLPKLNLENPDTYNHIIESAKYWLGYGLDGFRLDHVVGPSVNFWKKFSADIKSVNQEVVLIGEAWCEGIKLRHLKTINIKNKYLRWLTGLNQEIIQKEYIGVLDGVLDFNFRNRIIEYIAWKENPEEYKKTLLEKLNQFYKKFPAGYYLPNFTDNHDMSRFLFECGQNKERLKQALQLQFNLPQPPVIYYGTEAGLSHNDPVIVNEPHSDLKARMPMPWDKPDRELTEFCRELILGRK